MWDMADGSKYCARCKQHTLHKKDNEVISDGVGLALVLLTCGLFALLWIPLSVIQHMSSKWVCQTCGYEFQR